MFDLDGFGLDIGDELVKLVAGRLEQCLRGRRDEGYDLTLAVNLGARCLAPGEGLFET